MPSDKPTLTITLQMDSGERIEVCKEPIDIFAEHPSFAIPFYEAIGKIVMESGHVEYMLSKTVAMCRKLDTESPPKSKKIREGARKIDAIREALKNGRLFDEASDDPMWSATLKAAADIGKKRNELVHGPVLGFEAGPPPRMNLLHEDPDNPSLQPRLSTYTLLELQEILKRMQEVYLLLGGLGVVLLMDNVIRT